MFLYARVRASFSTVLEAYDVDRDGKLGKHELLTLFKSIGLARTAEQVDELWHGVAAWVAGRGGRFVVVGGDALFRAHAERTWRSRRSRELE